MSAPTQEAEAIGRRRLWLRRSALGAVLLVLAGAAVFAARSGGPGALWLMLEGVLREAGPVAFFAAMAVLPAVGFPLMPFTLIAGPVFGPQIGVGPTIACAIAAVAANVALSYGLAAGAMRPWVLRLAGWLGYRLPAAPAGAAWQVVTVVRLAPGLPFWMQSYLLGVIRAPFVAYMTLSTLIPAGYIAATIAGGDALARGRGRTALLAFAVLGFIAAALHLLRKRRVARAVE